MTNQSDIERIVMRRIHLIRILGLIISTMTFSILTLVFALWGIGREVWVAHILQNMPTDFANLPNFLFAAFTNTTLIVQILTLLTLTSLVFLAREIARVLLSFFSPARA